MYGKSVKFTQQMADDILTKHSAINRPINQANLAKIMKAIMEGTFREDYMGDPIQFDEEGLLLDGYHRLTAISRTGVSLTLYCVYDVQREIYGPIIDTGKARDAFGTATLLGLSLPKDSFAIVRRMRKGGFRQTYSNEDLINLVLQYEEPVRFAERAIGRKTKLSHAMVKAVVARAYFENPGREDILLRFGEVLRTGYADNPNEHAAITLRNYLLDFEGPHANREDELEEFTERAVKAFITARPINRLTKRKDRTPLFIYIK